MIQKWLAVWQVKQTDTFFHARVRLTGWYLVILISLIAGFTYLTFEAKESAYVRVYTVVSQYGEEQNKLVELQDKYLEFNRRFKERVLWLDAGLIFLGGFTAWWLAGKTLAPIKLVLDEKSAFAGNVSHGLRTPLASMLLQIEAYRLKQKNLLPQTKVFLTDLAQEINHMKTIVEGVLALTRTGAQQYQPKAKANLNQLFSRLKGEMVPLTRAKKQQLKIEIPKNEYWLKGDLDQWLQVMEILIDNAIKYTPVNGKIQVKAEIQIGLIKLIVADNGPGIQKEEQQKVFETYYRGKQKAVIPGLGLGLAIAAKMAENNGGFLKLKDNRPKGTKFVVTGKRVNG